MFNGLVYYSGSVDSNRSSAGFSVSKTGTGTYEITLNDGGNNAYIISATAECGGAGTPVVIMTDYNTNDTYFAIRTYNLNGQLINNTFHFVVYRK